MGNTYHHPSLQEPSRTFPRVCRAHPCPTWEGDTRDVCARGVRSGGGRKGRKGRCGGKGGQRRVEICDTNVTRKEMLACRDSSSAGHGKRGTSRPHLSSGGTHIWLKHAEAGAARHREVGARLCHEDDVSDRLRERASGDESCFWAPSFFPTHTVFSPPRSGQCTLRGAPSRRRVGVSATMNMPGMMGRGGMMGGGPPASSGDTPQVDTAENVQISSLALLKMLKHGTCS